MHKRHEHAALRPPNGTGAGAGGNSEECDSSSGFSSLGMAGGHRWQESVSQPTEGLNRRQLMANRKQLLAGWRSPEVRTYRMPADAPGQYRRTGQGRSVRGHAPRTHPRGRCGAVAFHCDAPEKCGGRRARPIRIRDPRPVLKGVRKSGTGPAEPGGPRRC